MSWYHIGLSAAAGIILACLWPQARERPVIFYVIYTLSLIGFKVMPQ